MQDASLEKSPNLAKERLDAVDGINQLWVSDITYIATQEGWMYLCVFVDVFSRKVVGWSIDDNMRADLVIRAFEEAWCSRQPGDGLVVHSDCGG